jgi:hypothetical protein
LAAWCTLATFFAVAAAPGAFLGYGRPPDPVRIPPATVQVVRNDSDEEAVFAMISVRLEDVRLESQPQDGFWPPEAPARGNS